MPNGMRLSCGAVLCNSQMELYHRHPGAGSFRRLLGCTRTVSQTATPGRGPEHERMSRRLSCIGCVHQVVRWSNVPASRTANHNTRLASDARRNRPHPAARFCPSACSARIRM